MDFLVAPLHDAMVGLTALLTPFAGDLATAGAIVVLTLGVRALLLPLAVRAARGQRARARLAPELAELRRRHGADPVRLREESAALFRREGVSPLAGFGPALLQAPFFLVLYRLCTAGSVAGHQNALLAHTLLGAPLAQNFAGVVGGGLFAPPSLVFLGLFALLALVAWWTARQVPADAPMAGVLRVLPFGTVVAAAFVPLAAGVYLLTSGLWTAAERAVLTRPA
ncbi:YidC/Oxa1 family membrane protein insertase [Actinomadura flavalba]|uniref:YidC/Oxa1 family membrane protein insertase n=1 Tax=Actinomadura flavalba TaxID=1120938 RepID=UPI0003812134|nr:membrane protein insertase YidC [Actinomadura flavalba]